MESLADAMRPNFSEHVEGGIFQAKDAFESHINSSSILLDSAISLIADHEDQGQNSHALILLRAYRDSMNKAVEEAYRMDKVLSVKAV